MLDSRGTDIINSGSLILHITLMIKTFYNCFFISGSKEQIFFLKFPRFHVVAVCYIVDPIQLKLRCWTSSRIMRSDKSKKDMPKERGQKNKQRSTKHYTENKLKIEQHETK